MALALAVMPGPAGHAARQPRAVRRLAWWLLLVAVLLGHALVTQWLQDNLVGWSGTDNAMPPRLEVAFVHALAPTAPLPAPAARAAHRRIKPRAARPAASAAAGDEASPAAAISDAAATALLAAEQLTPVLADAASAPPSSASQASAASAMAEAPSAAASAATAFEWPPSTRLTYVLTGNYRGELHGSARVQWVRQGPHYQVHLDITIGPSFAPLISRRMTSDGELGEQGLVPQRYDEATRVAFQQPRHATVLFAPELVTLANGTAQAPLPGLQDTASQFVQLTWLFTTRPELLRTGNTVTMPLALPRRIGRWVYDVLGEERLATPVGELDTFHLKPRLGEQRAASELSAELWFAPTLQYLPVRIRIQQDSETFVDLLLDAAPLQAAPEAPGR